MRQLVIALFAACAAFHGLDGAAVPGQWTSEFQTTKDLADRTATPMLVFWSSPGCGYCSRMDAAVSTAEFAAWAAAKKIFMVRCEGDAGADSAACKEFAKNATGKFPYMCVYWNTGAGTVKTLFSGRSSTIPARGQTLAAKLMNCMDANTPGWNPAPGPEPEPVPGPSAIADVYRFKMSLYIPKVEKNETSAGTRKYQRQSFEGELTVTYRDGSKPAVTVSGLVNRTWKINGSPVTYSSAVGDMADTRINLVGDNAKDSFRTPAVSFSLDADPSYNIGDGSEDNTLVLQLSGKGTTQLVNDKTKGLKYYRIRNASGGAAGTLGCGCRAYGHVSPTRVAGPYGATGEIDDVAAVYGTWQMTFRSRTEY